MFDGGSLRRKCPSARCALGTNVIYRNVDVFKKSSFSSILFCNSRGTFYFFFIKILIVFNIIACTFLFLPLNNDSDIW
jgi:hypothetical protein